MWVNNGDIGKNLTACANVCALKGKDRDEKLALVVVASWARQRPKLGEKWARAVLAGLYGSQFLARPCFAGASFICFIVFRFCLNLLACVGPLCSVCT